MNDLNQRQFSIIEIVKSLGEASLSVSVETLLSEALERSVTSKSVPSVVKLYKKDIDFFNTVGIILKRQ